MEPEGSFPHLKVPATCPNPEPDHSSPWPPHSTSWRFILKCSIPIYDWVLQVASFPQISPPKSCMQLSSPPYMLHVPPVLFFSICSPEK